MNKEKISEIVIAMFGTAGFDVNDGVATDLNTLGMDSLDTVEMMMEFDEQFHIDIEDEAVEEFQRVIDVVNYIETAIN